MSELAIELRLIGREIFHERYIDAGVVPLTLARAADRIEALENALQFISTSRTLDTAVSIARQALSNAALAPEPDQ